MQPLWISFHLYPSLPKGSMAAGWPIIVLPRKENTLLKNFQLGSEKALMHQPII